MEDRREVELVGAAVLVGVEASLQCHRDGFMSRLTVVEGD